MSRQPALPRVVFRVACGPRQGFGHLLRASRLASALEVPAACSLRGPAEAARIARTLGLTPTPGPPRTVLAGSVDLLVVDDPSARAAAPWIARARRLDVPVVSIHDLGLGAGGADLAVDGSLRIPRRPWGRGAALTGPRYAIVSRDFLLERRRRGDPSQDVIIALGGGSRRRAAMRLANAIRRVAPGVRVLIAGGLQTAHGPRPAEGITWLDRSSEFPQALASSRVAVVAGGVTLYESCVTATPRVAVEVVPAQRPTIAAFARRGAAIDAGRLPRTVFEAAAVAARVRTVLLDSRLQGRLARKGRSLVDGRGVERVAAALLRILAARRAE